MNEPLRVTLGQHSQAGRKPVNQDFHGASVPPEPHLSTKGIAIALADGISSSAVSQVASAAAVRGFLDDYYCTSEAWSVRRSAQRVLEASNSWLHAQTLRSDARFDLDRGHVCTFSALILKGREAHLLHVGDTRVYRLHAQALEQLTEDHRVRVSSVETYLGRALGAGPTVEIDYRHWAVDVGEVYLLATDGAYEHLDAATVHAALSQHGDDFDAAAAELTNTALARGSVDNLTVQLVRIDALPDPAATHLQAQREHLRLPPALQPRASFEGYTIVRELHASSRSHVHLAVDQASGQQVVLKTPSVDLRGDAAYLDRFLLEEWIARRIDSPHVIKACVADRPREHLYVALEYVDGQTLAQWMTDHPHPSLDEVRGLIEQAAKALHAFHRKEMLHQDLRPENLMIDRTGTVKVIDFGATHVAGLTEGTAEARPQALLGSLQYTAPEYFVGGVGSPRSELFSLAVIAYQMLTGHLPYGLQITQLRSPRDLQQLRYIPARDRRPDLPAWLDAVLRRALQPQVGKRQEALSEFVHDLSAPGPQYQSHRSTPLIERNPVVFWQTLTVLLALAVLVLLGLRVAGR
ncbi:MAG: bifunctional protein-serine/threonine kinase/phosphatase [Rubrivivax sp.]|nr:MAG: bifunctional protein-serine/threonine kinase/phosphatase [Rubrivivax sp.]